MNVIVRLEFELAFFEAALQYFSRYAKKTHPYIIVYKSLVLDKNTLNHITMLKQMIIIIDK